ncbi:MAG: PhoH family protein [Candidatus Nitrospinota bacterium M3_3B_026]
MTELALESGPALQDIAGVGDRNLRRIEKWFGVSIVVRGGQIHVRGGEESVRHVESLLSQLFELFEAGQDLNNGALKFIIPAFHDDPTIKIKDIFSEKIHLTTARADIVPRSVTQKEYVFAMSRFDIVLAIGPAGTGKTYLAMACAVSDLLRKRVSRIILTRPAVEAGEKLGFLPGDLYEKINPYLRPLHDALFDMLEADRVNRMIEQGLIEIAPLAYMRGRTLNDAFIILDEAQNATPDQMKMLLTRLGLNSKAVITGDITQIDLPSKAESGLVHVKKVLKDIPGIRFITFTERDVVRHELVKRILKAYEDDTRGKRGQEGETPEEAGQ